MSLKCEKLVSKFAFKGVNLYRYDARAGQFLPATRACDADDAGADHLRNASFYGGGARARGGDEEKEDTDGSGASDDDHVSVVGLCTLNQVDT